MESEDFMDAEEVLTQLEGVLSNFEDKGLARMRI